MAAADSRHCEQTLMFTDIVGYSRLMGRNEAMAIDMLGEYRNILLSHIEAQGGQLVECIGDAIFARFDTAASATAAAIAIQQHLQTFNTLRDKKLPRLQTRIGLHKGEVALRDNAVFGDTVNIAARLEPLAVADGICISQAVYDEIRYSLSAPAKRLGVQALKNIEQKIRVYLIKPAGINWRDHLHYFLRGLNKKIIAYRYPLTACLLAFIAAGFYFVPRWLVPGYAANYVEIADFQNLMNEKADADYFSAGITEAVRSQLADMRDVYIVDSKEGVRAPIRLEGSVQRLGDNLRIAYRLFRRKDNVQIAGGKLDGTYQDIFILQDRLVGEIARYLADEFGLQNFRPAPLRLTGDVTAYDYYLQGLEYLKKPSSLANFDTAIQNFNQALVHDNMFSLANAGLCDAYRQKYDLVKSAIWLNEAERFCLLALAQDETSLKAYKAIGRIYAETAQLSKAIEYLEKATKIDGRNVDVAIELAGAYDAIGNKSIAEKIHVEIIKENPKDWIAYDGYGYFLFRNGRYDEAINIYKKIIQIVPENLSVLNNIAAMYLFKGEFSIAIRYLEAAALIEPDSAIFANMGSVHYLSGNFHKALQMYEEALRLEPMNCQWMVYVADAYKFLPDKNEKADFYFNSAIQHADEDIAINPNIAKNYRYKAIALAYLGDISQAKEVIFSANKLDATSIDSLSVSLRVAIATSEEEDVRRYAKKLLDAGYSDKLLLANPDFSVLKEPRFSDLFDRIH
ncbi:tetratricopeptide repeat protein [Cellvibrio sp. BR]|uniref:tetratricopeptide repeat protein n=1 Tax=Cellvibrio sp. BR TaxID=1134474 RepID=UPI0002E927DF|nr:tetratricopeptide repeat protein [Cellvibrio sp. BR]